MTIIRVSTCSLAQWALDYEGNYQRILASIIQAKEQKARYRLGPELEVTGYVCYDHFFESDTFTFAWQVALKLIQNPQTRDILVDIGLPVQHKSVNYNCRLFFLNGRIVLIRPKLFLANDGNYRELRWFTPWTKHRQVEEHQLPDFVRDALGQDSVPFGDAVIETLETCLGTELCEELYTPDSPHIHMGLDGVEIFSNGSCSHHELRKLQRRMQFIQGATTKVGGVYLYSNFQGCDGSNLYFDGSPLIALNGQSLVQGTQFSPKDVEVISATIDLEDVRSYRGINRSIGFQSTQAPAYPRIKIDFSLACRGAFFHPTPRTPVFYHTPEEEIRLGPACWLWDYLRRSKAKGFLIPLSGGLDSASVAVIVFSMCHVLSEEIRKGDKQVVADVKRVTGLVGVEPGAVIEPRDICRSILHTIYMGTENSSRETRDRAQRLADCLGSRHFTFSIGSILISILSLVQSVLGGRVPIFACDGGSRTENLALQNIQARLRMILAYLFAQLLPWYYAPSEEANPGYLLVLGTSNVDECADINPIGAISKRDLRRFLGHAKGKLNLPILEEFLEAKPTAELEPSKSEQTDERDMGFSYEELSVMGNLRKVDRCGPLSMFRKLHHLWSDRFNSLAGLEEIVNRFFWHHSANRHKMTTLTPAYHAEAYSVDDHRFDLRPFLYPLDFTWQKRALSELVARVAESMKQ